MNVKCPNCQVEFESKDLAQTAKNGCFECPVCGKKIPSPLADSPPHNNKFPLFPILISCVILVILGSLYLFYNRETRSDFSRENQTVNKNPQVNDTINHNKQPAAPVENSKLSTILPGTTPATVSNVDAAPPLDKKQIVKKIAAEFHKTHTYTLEGDFVCLDMAIDVWNQLMTNGIEAKIMSGNVKENIMTWNYRQLLKENTHAWVVAKLSPTEKVAVETTAGVVIEQGMKNYAAYFKGIEFNNPAEVKKFISLCKKGNSLCQDAQKMLTEWKDNELAGKQRVSRETIAKKAQLEQRLRDCESARNDLDEFKSRAIFY
jgi:hypothetical protein